MLGDPQRNRFCCFCKYWYDPTNSALKVKPGSRFFDVDVNKKCKCMLTNLNMKSISICQKFEGKF